MMSIIFPTVLITIIVVLIIFVAIAKYDDERKEKDFQKELENKRSESIEYSYGVHEMLREYNKKITQQQWRQYREWEIEAKVNDFVVCPKCKGTKISVRVGYDDDAPAYASNSCNDCDYSLESWTFKKEDVF